MRTLFVSILILIGTYYALQGAFYGLLFYIGNAYFRPEEWVWSEWIRNLHLSLVSGVYVICLTLVSGQKLLWNGRTVLLFAFLLQGLLSTLFAEHSDYCWKYWVEFLKVVAVTYCMVVLVTDFARFRLVILVMVLALGVEQGKQGWFYLVTSPGGPNTNPLPFLGDNNGIAVGMLMLSPLVGLLAQTAGRKWERYFFQFLFIGCMYRALSTYSRGGFLAGIAMGTIWWLRSQHKFRGLFVALLVLSVILPALPNMFWDRMHTIQTYEEEQEESALSRIHFWAVAVDMAMANPILGIGFNGYNKTYDGYDFSNGKYGQGRSVHSSFFGVLAELGYMGICLYLAILLGAFGSCFQVKRLSRQHLMEAELAKGAAALEASLVAFVVGGSFVPWQYNEMLWHVIGLSIVLQRIATQHKWQALKTENLLDLSSSSLRENVAA